jgi:pimeloyl-ACP methyl ester carboxylesterase
MKAVKVQNSNGVLNAYVTESPQAKGTLVCVHGGPGGDHRGNDGIFDDIAKYCGILGYHIVQFDMFGAGRSDGKPQDITLKTQLTDYESVVSFAEEQLKTPIHVVGESMGATIAALDWKPNVSTHILLWPAFDLADTDLRIYFSEPWTTLIANRNYIEDNGMVIGSEFLREIMNYDFEPCFRLPASPCLLVHGKRDIAVPFEQSLKATKDAAGKCILFAHPNADHGLQRKDERDFTHEAIKWWLSSL